MAKARVNRELIRRLERERDEILKAGGSLALRDIYDDQLTGFGLRMRPNGSTSSMYRWTAPEGQQESHRPMAGDLHRRCTRGYTRVHLPHRSQGRHHACTCREARAARFRREECRGADRWRLPRWRLSDVLTWRDQKGDAGSYLRVRLFAYKPLFADLISKRLILSILAACMTMVNLAGYLNRISLILNVQIMIFRRSSSLIFLCSLIRVIPEPKIGTETHF